MALFIVGICLYFASLAAGLVALFFGLPGTLIILISSIAYAIITKFQKISIPILIVLLILYLIGEIIEELLGAFGAKTFGASRRAMWGAVWGGLIGGIIGFPFGGIGALFLGFIGVFLGPFLVELFLRRGVQQSISSGAGGVMGKASSFVVKELIALIMVGLAVADIFLF